MTQRVVGGQTFNLGYDAENRLVSVSGAVTASFGYDGDSRRVKSTIGNTTTYFVGNIYESTGGVATKYYYAGAARIAMRVGTADPYYLLTDHIGSTTVTTDASGSLVSELKYGPWGEVRSGTAPTNYTFTGQYSNTSDFGLMFYNARWYDPSLSRFVSPDSIIPNPADPQAWNRYTYVQNRPTVLADPTGHRVACGEQGAACDDGALPVDYSRKLTKSHQIERIFPGITINNPYAFSLAQLNTLTQALGAVFAAFGNNRAAFRNAFGPMSFTLVRQGSLGENVAARADMWDTARIRLTSRASYGNLIHEMGHIFDGRFYRNGKTKTLFSEYFADHLNSGTCSRSPCGSGDGFEAGTWKPSGIHTDYAEDSSLEDFADSFQAAITGDYRNVDQERIAFIRIAIALMVAPYSN
jgi:RHS repeat-associated protein